MNFKKIVDSKIELSRFVVISVCFIVLVFIIIIVVLTSSKKRNCELVVQPIDPNDSLLDNLEHGAFECVGNCYCSGERRVLVGKTSKTIKGISLVVTAMSSVVAFRMAQEHFHDECVELLSDTCSPASIKSEVQEECSELGVSSLDQEEGRSEENIAQKPNKRFFHCQGKCVTSGTPRKVPNFGEKGMKKLCEENRPFEDFEVDCEGLETGCECQELAVRKFIEKGGRYDRWCEVVGRMENSWGVQYKMKGKLKTELFENRLCEQDDPENISCSEIDRIGKTKFNIKYWKKNS